MKEPDGAQDCQEKHQQPAEKTMCPPNGGDFHRAFDVLLTFDLAEIEFLVHGSPGLVCALIELI